MATESYFKHFTCNKTSKKNKKVHVLKCADYKNIIEYNFTVAELKDIIKTFRLPKPKNKRKEYLVQHCINCLYLKDVVVKIQRSWRNKFIRNFNKTLGPSFFFRKESNNIDDFMTTESVNDIDYYNFFSYKDKDSFIYTFNFISIYTLILKHLNKNPYNRIPFDQELIDLVLKRKRYNKILNKLPNDIGVYSPPTLTYIQRVHRLFQKMDELGNYTNSTWFTNLRRHELSKFMYELYDIWNYRAQLSRETQIMICPPNGNPFQNITPSIINHMNIHQSMRTIQTTAVNIMEKLIFSSTQDENQNLGALYILSALTLVSTEAQTALPWLYSSVHYN